MYEPEKILVQNAGIDPGVAALLQNANKGNMDPAALMAMMNNGGFGGNGGWWWIWIILIFFCWGGFGGNGFGRGSDDASRLASQLNTDTNTSLLMQAIQGNKSVPAERSIINDTSIGLTVATNKEEIANMVRQNYNEFKAKKEAASKYDEEMEKCKDILDQLEAQVEIPTVTNTVDNSKEINDLKNDVADIRKMIEDAKKMFMGGFPKPPMPPMPNVPAPQMK